MNNIVGELSPASRAVLGVLAVVLFFNIAFFSAGWVGTIKYTKAFVFFDQHDDSWDPMDRALKYLMSGDSRERFVYQHIFFDQGTRFQYPLTSLLLPYALLKTTNTYIPILMDITWAMLVLNIFFVVLIFRHVNPPMNRLDAFVGSGAIVLLSFLFYPLVKAYNLGQIQVWSNALFAGLFYCWMRGWQAPSGVLLALICLIKPQFVLVALWAVVRRRWRFVIFFAGVVLIGVMLSIASFGLDNNVNYLSVLKYISQHGETFYPNQSMMGLLNRWFLNGNILEFYGSLPAFHPVVYYGSFIFAAVWTLTAIVLPKMIHREGGILDLSVIAVTATMISPIAWEHHYGILLPIYVFLFVYLMRAGKPFYWWILGISYFLASNYITLTKKFALVPGWNIVLSYLFWGALMLLVLLFCLLFERNKI